MKNQFIRFINSFRVFFGRSSISNGRQRYAYPTRNLLASVMAIVILVAVGCRPLGDQPCGSTEDSKTIRSDFSYLTSNVEEVHFTNIDEAQEVVNLIIRNEVEYRKYLATIQGDTLPAIDFNEYILLAGRAKTKHTDLILAQSVMEACGETIYRVRIGGGIGTAPSIVKYFALIPVNNIRVRFEINME